MKQRLIIQTSPCHTGSTLLVNILYGLFEHLYTKKIISIWTNNWDSYFEKNEIIIIKCHNTNINELIFKYGDKYDMYFCCSERNEYNYLINIEYKNYKNVLIIEYNNLLESETNTLENIVDYVYENINMLLKDKKIKYNTLNSIDRIKSMNLRYNEIINQKYDFNYIDPFYEIHGNHKNRKKTP